MRTCPLMISLGLMFPVGCIADEPVQTVLFYIVGIGIDGEATVGPLTADIDVSASEVFESLEFGAMGSYRWDSDPWAFQVDLIYASLAGDKSGSQGFLRSTLDLDQAMIEADMGYQLGEHFELMVGARYWDFEAEIALFGSGGVVQRSEGAESWVDPLIGLRVVAPISESWTFIARGDVGGFGVGSDFTPRPFCTGVWANNSAWSSAIEFSISSSKMAAARKGSISICRRAARESGSPSPSDA
jgi:hypothetical protein